MSGKRIKALFVAVLLALLLSVSGALPASSSVVLAGECSTTGFGCD